MTFCEKPERNNCLDLPVRNREGSAGNLAERRPELAGLWHPSLNGELTPRDVSPSSHKRVWWQCREGHTWQAKIYSLADGSGCPYCSGRLPIPGQTDLESTHPRLAAEWDTEKNGTTAAAVSAGSAVNAWWRCPEGHSYHAVVHSRTAGSGCPYCSGKSVLSGFNDLATTNPELLSSWADERLSPTEVNRGSHRMVRWSCERGHRYEAAAFARVAGNGCPYCAGHKVLPGFNDLATTHPQVAAQWDQERNGTLTPAMVTRGSNKKVWWRCSAGHVWQALVFSRTREKAADCPVCAGRARVKMEGRYRRPENRNQRRDPIQLPEAVAL